MVEIGKIIEKVVREKRIPVSELAKLINTNRNNVYHIFRRQTIDTDLLLKICNVTQYDFFKHFISENTLYDIVREKSNTYTTNSEILKLKQQILDLEKTLSITEGRLKDKEIIIDLLKK